MKTSEIVTFEYENDETIKYHTRVIISPGCIPARCVLRKIKDDEWVTHEEVLQLYIPREAKKYPTAIFKHYGFNQGNYFHGPDAFERAMKDYKERSKRY